MKVFIERSMHDEPESYIVTTCMPGKYDIERHFDTYKEADEYRDFIIDEGYPDAY